MAKAKQTSKFLALVLALTMLAAVCAFTSCNTTVDQQPASVMTVSLNPEVEFVLNGENQVIAVNALNDEGNLVISADAFKNVEGKSAEEAAKLFVQVSAESGYLVSGNASVGNNTIEFSFSVDTTAATELYNKVKTSVESYLSTAKTNITATLEKAEAIALDDLRDEVAEVRPDLTEAEIAAMTEKQLLAEILEARKATADIYSQELKEAYYQAKAYAMEQAKLEVVRGKLTDAQQGTLDIANAAYTSAYNALETARTKWFIDETSAYQQALATFRSRKTEYLKIRNEIAQMESSEVTEAETARLDACIAALETAETALESAKKAAELIIDSAQSLLNTAYKEVASAISSVNVEEISDEISAKQTEALTTFTTQFESTYAAAEQSAEESWKTMLENLKNAD